jgi:penicillin-binding protein 2
LRNQFVNRKYVVGGIIVLASLILLFKLFFLQVIDPGYKISASRNSRQGQIEFSARGLIYDRHGKVLVYNQPAYDLMITPREAVGFDTTALCSSLDISKEELILGIKKARKYSTILPSALVSQISPERYASLQEKMYKFKGFHVRTRMTRAYDQPIASHVVGYLGEVDRADLKDDTYYSLGDYLGKAGLEKQYENELRGIKGIKYVWVDVHNKEQGSYEGGRDDRLAQPGKTMVSSIDAELQAYGEKLMAHKVGSIVAIEPSSGEILAMISSPGFDPGDLVGRKRTVNYVELSKDSLDPMFNRATKSRYAPGSIFKIVQALIALDMGVIQPGTGFECNKSLIGCHNHPEATNVKKAIQYSCNPYFYQVYKKIILNPKTSSIFKSSEIGLTEWKGYVEEFGFGTKWPIDYPSVSKGVVPGPDLYNGWYGRGRWAFSTIYSNCNGQGELETVPIQIANLAAIIANRGFYYVPHFIKSIEGQEGIPEEFEEKHVTRVDSEYFDLVVQAMHDVIWEARGTGYRARIPGVEICGKTGTVENSAGEDHSGFFAFAPMENPKIALAVYVENAGGGGTWAAPIASLMTEKYIKGSVRQVEKEERILNLQFY